ncbi:MAG: dihydrofolate reductase family protein [Actinomycetes bacterium]|jgi:dihydrofolate reductase|nr:dihydrofolate reductase family protein [Actinomycetes bacterium]
MRTVTYMFTQSLDGYIADGQGSVSWLAGAPNIDYGFAEFYDEIQTVLLGRRTYEQILDRGDFFPYADRETLVFSSNDKLRRAADRVCIVTDDPLKTVARLKLGEGGTIWLGGGAHLAGSLFVAGLLDELRVFTQPIVLGSGLSFFADVGAMRKPLELTHTKCWPAGVLEARYSVAKQWRSDV